ncbi:MAG: hypothetical protein JNK75_03375 [Betaproteobacteria bacterium]|nr:hypothetical protein [Betaproteobacteria bacterium]
MSGRSHLRLLGQATVVWAAFWVLGWPDYYQQYSLFGVAIATNLLTAGIALLALAMLGRVRPAARMSRALWISFYYSVPLAVYDMLYCGLYLGHGWSYLEKYWYLTIYYPLVPLIFIPTAMLMPRVRAVRGDG